MERQIKIERQAKMISAEKYIFIDSHQFIYNAFVKNEDWSIDFIL